MSVHTNDPSTQEPGPRRPARSRPRLSVTAGLIVVNAAVFLLWQAATSNAGLGGFMVQNFMVSAGRLQQGSWWTLLTAVFSHFELWHIGLNMFVLWSFGSVLERLVGGRLYLAFYLASGVFASLCHCLVETLVLHDPTRLALGASGAVSAVLLAYSLLFPRQRILLFFVLPVPALVAAILFVGLDVFGLVAQGRGTGLPIGHGAHLGGALAGFMTWLVVLRPRLKDRIRRVQGPIALSRDERDEVDRLRGKISRDGVDALTAEEREFLRRLHERHLQ